MEIERQRKRKGCQWIPVILFAVGLGVLLFLFPGDSRIRKASASEECFVSGDWKYQLDEGGNAILIDYNGNQSELVVDEKIDGHTVVGLITTFVNANVRTITLPDTVTSIGDRAFQDCRSLSEIRFPSELISIGRNAFDSCSSLWSIKFPEGLQSIDENAFFGCDSLTDVLLPAGLKKINSTAFDSCDNLSTIQLDDCNQNFCLSQGILYNQDKTEVIMICDRSMQTAKICEGVKRIDDCAFYSCDNLAYVDLPDTLEYIGKHAFKQCGSLQQFCIPKNVTEIGEGILYNCCYLKQVEILGSLKELNGICDQCPLLEQVSLPDGLREISKDSFYCCWNLKQITLPKSVEVIEEGAFHYAGLTSLLIPSGVTQVEERALTAPNLESITVAEGNNHFYTQPEGLYNEEGVLLAATAASNKISISNGCTRIGKAAFYGHGEITEAEIPDTVTEIGEEAFTGCRKLTEVHMGKQLQAIGRDAFWKTSVLSEQAEIEDGIQYLGCYAISCLEESAGETLRIREGCTLLADNFSISNDTLKYLWLPDSLQYIGKAAFWESSSLQEIIGGHSLTSIGERAFMGNRMLKRVLIQGKKISIGTDAFEYCRYLSELMIDAEKVVLADYCFGGMTDWNGKGISLNTLVLPNLDIPLRKTGLSYIFSCHTQLLLTNMPIEELKQGKTLFADCEGLRLYLPDSRDAFPLGDSLSEQGISVSYRDEWHLCRFMIHGQMKKLDILPDGATVTLPVAEGESYFVTSEGPLLADIHWDLDGDGVADELPGTIHDDIIAEALYHIQEEKHSWLVKEVIQELTCTQDGDVLYYCSGCGEEKRVQTKAQGHVFSKEWTTDWNAGCIEFGEKSHHCIREGCIERNSVTPLLPTGHSWDVGVITVNPQIGLEGEKVFTCTVCGEQRKEVIVALPEPTKTPMPTKSMLPEESEKPVWPEKPQERPTLKPSPTQNYPMLQPSSEPESVDRPEVSLLPETSPLPETSLLPETPPLLEMSPLPETSPLLEMSPLPEVSPLPEMSLLPETSPLPEMSPEPGELRTPEGLAKPLPVPNNTSVPEQSAMPYESPVPAHSPVWMQPIKVIGFRVKAGYRKIALSWTAEDTNVQCWVYRSGKKGGRQVLLKKLRGDQCSYSDKQVVAEKLYYYQIKLMQSDGKKMKNCGSSRICKAALKERQAPLIQIRKRRRGKTRYLEITLKKYTGNRLEVFYRKRKTGAYRKLKLRTNIIAGRQSFRIKYLSNHGNLFFRFRTYGNQGGVRMYSRYTAEKKVVLGK